MKYNKHLVLLIVLLSVLQGCVYDLKMKKIELQSKSPLGEIKPLTIVVDKFDDESPFKDKDKDAVCRAGATKTVLNKNKKVADIVSEAISNELKRNGHNITNSASNNANADLIIQGCVSKCGWVGLPEGMWGVKFNTIVEVKVSYMTRNSNKTLFRIYNGSATRTWIWGTMKDVKELMESAFSNMVEEFSTDHEMLEVLKELEKAKYKM